MRQYKIYIISLLIILVSGVSTTAKGAKTTKKPDAAQIFENARQAYLNYDFEEASDLLDEYRIMQEKAKKPLDEDFSSLQKMVTAASNAYDRVQKIVVVDSINVPRYDFQKFYNLSLSAGRVGTPSQLGLQGVDGSNEVSFISEGNDYFAIPMPDEEGNLRIKNYRLLLDGTWEGEDALKGEIDLEGDYCFPFMSGDGQSLYFANNGEDSMGGYDIFVAQKAPISGEVMQPLNLGMPFNSPYDDFMMAMDEEAGLGWWATDRNQPGGDVTIYVFIIEDVRKNYDPGTENLKNLARLTDINLTQEEGKDYSKIRRLIRKAGNTK